VVPVGDKTEPEPVALSAEKAEIISRLLNEILKSLNWNIRIRVDKSTETIVTQIVDTEKNEIIKQIPPQELLEIMSRLKRLVGLLLDREA
jgi:flagellar protein FlaG